MPRYAAIDIGSNSVRMLAADVFAGGKTEVLAADREVTRLGESVFRTGSVSQEAIRFVTTVLARMSQAYAKLDVAGVRACATAAIRDASNQQEFLDRASEAVGSPVEVISGHEEARLIHLGVHTHWPDAGRRVLIIDIGGGSAELVAGTSSHIEETFSRPLGAVRLTEVFLKSDPPKKSQIERLHEFIEEKLSPAQRKGLGTFDRAIATSSTAGALICAVNRIPRERRDEADRMRATLPQVRKLYGKLCETDTAGRTRLTGIGPRRAQIIVPGVAVLLECMERFHLPALYYSTAGVRDGIIADLAERRIGEELSRLTRDQRNLVEQMANRYRVPLRHARKVAAFSHYLFESLRELHRLPPYWGRLLEAAAILYDTGHFVADTAHHKHAEYIVRNSDLPGFTDREKGIVSQLCRFHRKSMPGSRHPNFQQLDSDDRRGLLLMIPILRLADALDFGKEQKIERIACTANDDTIQVSITGAGKLDLEQWAAERVSDLFRSEYGRSLAIFRDAE
jgi:exopolyphosphatase/guanosine-5'-triphosphate,3'-diphosphate pyrophosphatase